MEQSKSQRIKVSMNHGLIVGLILIVMSAIVGLFKIDAIGLFRFLNWAVLIGSVYYSIKTWRDQYCDGLIKYSQALGFGVRVMFFASIIYGFYSMIYMNWINPDSVKDTLAAVEEGYFLMGLTDEQIEQYMEIARKMQTPGWQMFTTVLGTTFTGLIISLIVSIFVRKEGDPFQSAMDKVQDSPTQDNQ